MAVTLSLFAGAGAQFFDNNGNVLSGGKIYTYQAGTTTPLATYTANSESAFHTNPIILDSAGRVPSGGEIWLQLGVGYKFVLKTSAEVLIATYDNIPSSAQPPAANDADSIMYEQGYTVTAGSFVVGKIYRIASVGTTDFTLIGATTNTVGTHFIATGMGTGTGTAELSQTVETKLRQTVSVKDFGAVGDGVTNDSAAFAAAIAAYRSIYVPPGTYITSFTLLGSTQIVGAGLVTVLKAPVGAAQVIAANTLGYDMAVENLRIDGNNRNSNGMIVGNGVQGQHANTRIQDVVFNNCNTALTSNKETYATIRNCKIDLCNIGIGGQWFSSNFDDTTVNGCTTSALKITGAVQCTFRNCHFFSRYESVETLCHLTDCYQIYFLTSDFEPLDFCTTAQVYIESSSAQTHDIIFSECWFLPGEPNSKAADCIKTAGSAVTRVFLDKTSFINVAGGFFNLNIGSTGSGYFYITETYARPTYSGPSALTTSDIRINKPNNQIIARENGATTNILTASGGEKLRLSSSEVTVNNSQNNVAYRVRSQNRATALLVDGVAGNLGLGTTPSAWGADYVAVQQGAHNSMFAWSGGTTGLVNNAYNDNTDWIYRTANRAALYEQTAGGVHTWRVTPTVGTVGNPITFTQAMRIDQLANLSFNVSGTAPALSLNSQLTFELTSNTQLKIFVRGTDGVTRSVSLTLA
jgi:hypothetical protein